MTCLLIAGVGPTPPERPARQMAPGLRLWSLALASAGEGRETHLLSCDYFGHAEKGGASGSLEPSPGLRVHPCREEEFAATLTDLVQTLAPQAVVATSDWAAARVARALPPEIPLWVDLYGDPVAEGQLIAARTDDDRGLAPLIANMLAILDRADRLSTCSRAQRHAMLGQLGLAGRLNRQSCHSDLVSVLPALLVDLPEPAAGPRRADLGIAPEAPVVLWSGGFNTWTDVQTLHAGLVRALGESPDLHFVCVGGAIDRHNPGTYGEFEALLKESAHRERCHLLGWKSQGEVAAITAWADIGLNIDAPCHEAELGTRTRILEWGARGMAVCSTPLSEMAQDLAAAGGLETSGVGDPASLSECLIRLAGSPEARREIGEAAKNHIQTHWTPETGGAPLRAWLTDPVRNDDESPTNTLRAWVEALEPALRSDQEPPADLAAAVSRLAQLEGSALVRLRDALPGRHRRR